MKLDVDLIRGYINKMSFEEVKKLMEEARAIGFEEGIQEVKENKTKYFPPRPAPPARKPTLPENNKEMLNKLFNGDREQQQIGNMKYQEGYRKGFHEGVKAARENKSPKFDPQLHVDNSLYGYASTLEMQKLNSPNGHLTILRDKNKWAKDADVTFVKITPYEEPKI